MQFNFGRFALIACLAVSGLSAAGAEEISSTNANLRTADVTPEHLESLQWRVIGPAIMGGRVSDLAVVESNPAIFYVGTATGNLWKTTNHGTTWQSLFENEAVSSIGDVTLAPSNPNIVWVGTGESNNRQSSPWGNGVYKSVDGGKNWQHMGLEETHHIGRILIHPTNPDIVFVAAAGHLWGPNAERGVFRTLDGGKHWEKTLFVDEDTGATDLAMHPSDPDTILAAMYQRRRTAWGFNGGGPGSGIYRSSDGGANWTRLKEGLPSGPMGRIGLDFYAGDPNLVYATVEADQDGQGVYRSDDRGDKWEKVSSTNPRPMYFSQIRIDPSDPKRIYVLGVQLHVSDDGGKEFNDDGASRVHSDHHAMWVDPANSNHLIIGGDGGVSISMDRSQTWNSLENIPIGQFYEVGYDMQDPYFVCGGLQDNGSWCGPSANRDRRGIRNSDWFNVLGGDGFYARIDPHDPNIIFSESQNGNLARVDRVTGETKSVRPTPREDSPGRDQLPPSSGRGGRFGPSGPSYRFNWNAPVLISSHDPQTIYYGGNVLLRSDDRGNSWREISPDLTRQKDRNKLEIMGIAGEDIDISRHDGVSHFGTLTTIGESPLNPQVLYTGSDDGSLQVTRNGGKDWTPLHGNIPVPDGTYVSRVVASHAAEGRAYATFDGHYNDDYHAYAFVTEDFGQTWTSLSEGLPETSINVITEHFRNHDLLFVGNEMGVYFSVDRGGSWLRLKNNLPTVPVDDIQVHPRENDLIIGTHGRSVWIMDDITPLEQLASAASAPVHLFAARQATLFNPYSPQGWRGDGEFSAPNPSQDAQIRYFISEEVASKLEEQRESAASGRRGRGRRMGGGQRRQAPEGFQPTPEMRQRMAQRRARRDAPQAEIRITAADGEVLRRLEGPVSAGLQTVSWDLRLEPPYRPDPNDQPEQGRRRFGGGRPSGPRVLPGSYGLEMEIDGKTIKGSLEVRGDPRIQVSDADLKARQEALMQLYRISKPAYEVGRSMRRLQDQLREAKQLLDGNGDGNKELSEMAEEISKELEEIQQGPGRTALGARRLGSGLERSTSRPTPDQLYQIEEAVRDTLAAVERINRLITGKVPALYKAMNKAGVRPDPGSPIEVPKIGG